MVNSSLNWASVTGVFLFLFAIPAATAAGFQLYFNLSRRADTSPMVIAKLATNLFQFLGRLLLIPVGLGLFFQGWRLDQTLQLLCMALALGIVVESAASIAADYQKWRYRLGRAKAVIHVKQQPCDEVLG